MKIVLWLGLMMGWLSGYAQSVAPMSVYTDTYARYQLTYPRSWLQQPGPAGGRGPEAVFYAGGAAYAAPAVVTLTVRRPAAAADPLAAGQLDTAWRQLRQLPQLHVLRLDQQEAAGGLYQEMRFDYTYAPGPPPTPRAHVLVRRVWRGGYEFQLEYRASVAEDARYLPQARRLLESFGFTGNGFAPSAGSAPAPRTRAVALAPQCDDKMYGIAALRRRDEQWEDDCRTIHEFSAADPGRAPKIHRQVLPFQSYALAKGFDNCLYSVTKAPTNAPEYVYRYDPATRQGRYTPWQLPAQGPEAVWISAATDEHGDLYFATSDAAKLVKVSPATGTVTVLWTEDPLRPMPYYPKVGFKGAGTHANFGLDEGGTLYQVYSTDGSLLTIDLNTGQPAPAMTPLTGLPRRGGYSDLLFQNDASGRRRLYLAGPQSLYRVDMGRRRAYVVRRGVYTDLAGCNVFRAQPRPAALAAAAPSRWQGRVLDARTWQPLPQAQLRLSTPTGPDTAVPLASDGAFSFGSAPGQRYTAQVQLTGYLTTDTAYVATAGPLVQDILLQPLAVGATLALESVQFAQGQAVLLPSSFPTLNQLLAALTATPELTIELRGHTDNVGDPQKNQVLSEERVAAVKAYLVGRGIAESRITGVGFGGTRPRASNAQESTRRLNRRVEVRVTGGSITGQQSSK